jgi:hypothetical protein
MGEIAEAMLDGTLCSQCGDYLGGDEGYPVTCDGCKRAERREPRLPRFSRYSIPPRAGTVECPHCPSWVKPGRGLHDHMKAKHPEKLNRKEA